MSTWGTGPWGAGFPPSPCALPTHEKDDLRGYRLGVSVEKESHQGAHLRKAVEIASNFSAKGPKHAAMKQVWVNQTMGLPWRSFDSLMAWMDNLRSSQLGISDRGSFIVVWAMFGATLQLGWIALFRSGILADGTRSRREVLCVRDRPVYES
jgi:hypothetical protein